MSPQSWPLFYVYICRFHFGLAAVALPLPVRLPRQPGLLATPFHGAVSALLLACAALPRGVFFPLWPFAFQPGLFARPLCALAQPRVFFALRICAAPPPV